MVAIHIYYTEHGIDEAVYLYLKVMALVACGPAYHCYPSREGWGNGSSFDLKLAIMTLVRKGFENQPDQRYLRSVLLKYARETKNNSFIF